MPQAKIASRSTTIIEQVKHHIRQKGWLPGERIPSIRKMSSTASVSPATVSKAYEQLEIEGWIYAKPQSGYYVAAHFNQLTPSSSRPLTQVSNQAISINRHVFEVLSAVKKPDVIPFGSAFPDPSLFPIPLLGRLLSRTIRTMPINSGITDLPPGCLELRRVIAQRYINEGMTICADDIVITSGATEALGLSLAALTKPGDTIAVESPVFYGALQAIERLHLNVVEIPSSIYSGIDIEALTIALEQQNIKACWLMSHFQNPTGASLTVEKQQALYDLLAGQGIPILEDDVYGELYFGQKKPVSMKAIDTKGLVLHCSSFSKCLAPGFRVGWAIAGRYSKQMEELQLMSTLSVATPNQQVLAHYLRNGGYDHHLRQLRRILAHRLYRVKEAIEAYFPEGTSITLPKGGYFLWVTLPFVVDTSKLLFELLEKHQISIAPGTLFSAQKQFKHCMRINGSYPFDDNSEEALRVIANLLRHYHSKPR
ncbi:PLP-dependent aminotransferase family protein [Photobacterium makurazakiensis]|uniref:aminotransferase-like domain-containing protein n=1 Tax=Photobacterium makurazakiensis TaxID=2910234 RepID=UPI003D0A8C97